MKDGMICVLVALLFIFMLATMCYFKKEATFWREAYLEFSRARTICVPHYAIDEFAITNAPHYAIEDITTTNMPPSLLYTFTNAIPVSR